MFYLLLFICLLGCACEKVPVVNNSTVNYVDLNRYLGGWYEIARFDHSFERNVDYAMAQYTLNGDGTIKVVNSGIKKGKATSSEGKAKTTSTPGLLRVSFFGPFYGDYRIMMLGPDYEYSLVGGSNGKYLWILSRTPILPKETLDQILAEAQRRNYPTDKFIWVPQDEKLYQNNH